MQNLAKAGVFLEGVNGIDERPAWQIAYQGKAAMLYTGSWAPAVFDAEATQDWLDNYSVHKVPAVTADGVHYTGDGSGEGWVVNAKSPAKDITLEFVKYMFSPEVYDEHIAGLGGFPAMREFARPGQEPEGPGNGQAGWTPTEPTTSCSAPAAGTRCPTSARASSTARSSRRLGPRRSRRT